MRCIQELYPYVQNVFYQWNLKQRQTIEICTKMCTIYFVTGVQNIHPATERRCYFVTTSLISWAQKQSQPCIMCLLKSARIHQGNGREWLTMYKDVITDWEYKISRNIASSVGYVLAPVVLW